MATKTKVLKAKTNEGDDISIYIEKDNHKVEDWNKRGVNQYVINFDLERIGGWGTLYIDTIAQDSKELAERGLCLYGNRYNYASVNGEVMKKVINLINDFVKENNLRLDKE